MGNRTPVGITIGLLMLGLTAVSACTGTDPGPSRTGGELTPTTLIGQGSVAPGPSGEAPDDDGSDRSEWDDNEPDDNEPDENEPDENEPDENEPDEE